MAVNRVIGAALAVAVVVAGWSCNSDSGSGEGKTRVVASFAAVAELARQIGGDGVTVTDLTPSGAEPHDAELRAEDLDDIEGADLMVFVGGGFQPAVERAARRAERSIDLLSPAERERDPHIWLDPVRWSEAVNEVEEALSAADPPGQDGYRERAAALRAQLQELHSRYEAGLRHCRVRLIVSSHDSFRYLAMRYGLEAEAIAGLDPEAEPDPKRLAELADVMRRQRVTTVFTEPLVPSSTASALAREVGAGATTAVLDPLESAQEGGYRAAMERNLSALRSALGCD